MLQNEKQDWGRRMCKVTWFQTRSVQETVAATVTRAETQDETGWPGKNVITLHEEMGDLKLDQLHPSKALFSSEIWNTKNEQAWMTDILKIKILWKVYSIQVACIFLVNHYEHCYPTFPQKIQILTTYWEMMQKGCLTISHSGVTGMHKTTTKKSLISWNVYYREWRENKLNK